MKTEVTKKCPVCLADYWTADKRQVYCGHKCAAKAIHAGKRITTPNAPPGPELGNSSNPRYTQDEKGQWWYTPMGGNRSRATVKVCRQCSKNYLMHMFHGKNSGYCSRACSGLAHRGLLSKRFSGKGGSNWKGGRQVRKGYVWVWVDGHPSRKGSTKPYVLEHRLVMEKHLGRYLTPDENIHHRNGIRDDNRIENLELWSIHQPPGQRVTDKLEAAKALLAANGFEVIEQTEKKT